MTCATGSWLGMQSCSHHEIWRWGIFSRQNSYLCWKHGPRFEHIWTILLWDFPRTEQLVTILHHSYKLSIEVVHLVSRSAMEIRCHPCKQSIMRHFMWVFTVCQSTSLSLSRKKRVKLGLDARKPVFGVSKQQRRRPACASASVESSDTYGKLKCSVQKLSSMICFHFHKV